MISSLLRQLRKSILRALPQAPRSDQKPLIMVMKGFRAMLEDDRFEVLIPRLNEIEVDWRGEAFLGAGLGFAIFDYLLPWRKRLQAFVHVVGDPYIIPVYVGMGMALARLRSKRPERFLARLEYPIFRWMVIDGYAFSNGYFSQRRYLEEKAVPMHLSNYARRVFDQGLGRAIWFALSENIHRVATTIAAFPQARQADLWSGAGFSCAYTGSPMERQALEMLRAMAGSYRSQLALAGTLAAKRRQGLGHITSHTELACQVFCGLSGEMAAHIANDALENLPTDGIESPHQIWRERIEAQFVAQTTSEIQSEMDSVQ